ncbi:T9SS type A sorting domain-containing protein [Cryomorpha ignava]|uniref:T9SS type A sorting domain-containing protein n=1 Tax=Cryomorpha ignava TaxID=101383 RepID=A0A7K3WTB2_9FLAO|nr:T9SS type A sorting domain-containing protein [Cryomorpha ignava]NEN24920.1 T9SS type A sorting domain-containing protein [Cryomorpha ignava]
MTYSKKLQTASFRLFTSPMMFLILISLPGFVQAQWNYLNSPVTYDSYMEVVNRDTVVYSYGNTGKIYRTVNGGETWSDFQMGLEYSWIFDFDFPTNQVGYGCGGTYFGNFTDVIIKTENAGETWDTLSTNSFGVYTFDYIDFLNVDTGFVASTYILLRTEDGGANFTTLVINGQSVIQIRDIYLTSSGVLFASCTEQISPNNHHISIYRSSDFGETWQEVYADDMEDADNFNNRFVATMHFPSPQTGYATGGNGLLLKTTDAGLTWSQSFISPFTNLSTLYFTSVDIGYTNNAGGIHKTTDGGNTWVAQNMNVPAIVKDIQFATENTGYALTDQKIYKTSNGGDVLTVENPKPSDGISVFPNPARDLVSVKNENGDLISVKIIDVAGRIVKTINQNFENINISEIALGNYFLRIESNEGVVSRKLVVK